MHPLWSALLPSEAHPASRPNAVPRLLLPTARPAAQYGRPWLGQLQPRQRRRREALPPVGAAASEGFIATGAGIFPVDGGRWAPLLARTPKAKANLKLLALCTGQLLMSVASVVHDTYMPLYLSEGLHLSNTKMGNLHAVNQFLAGAVGMASGRLADMLSPGRVVILGTLLSVLCKPMFALAGAVRAVLGDTACVQWLMGAKILDRACKGVREAPTKALIGELAAQSGESPSAAFSLRQSLSTLGMLVGATAASLAFHLSGRSYMATFAMAAAPAAAALLLMVAAFGGGAGAEAAAGAVAPASAAAAAGSGSELQPSGAAAALASDGSGDVGEVQQGRRRRLWALLRALQPGYWQALVTVALLSAAHYDVSFVTLHANTIMDKASLPMLTPLMMIPVVALATPVGLRARASVRARNTMLLMGMAFCVAGNLSFAFFRSMKGCLLGATCLGIHMAMSMGVSHGMLSSYIPAHAVPGLGRIDGTAWSLTDLMLGAAMALSNTQAGRLCDLTQQLGMGNVGCFLGGAAACSLSMLALVFFATWGDLGKDDSLQPAARQLQPAPAAAQPHAVREAG